MKKIIKVSKIDEGKVKDFLNGNLVTKEAEELEGSINIRCGYIIQLICEKYEEKCDYWEYNNSFEDDGGFFDRKKYKDEVFYHNSGSDSERFPTRWIWEDFEDELIKEVEKDKIKEQKRLQKIKKQKEEKIKKQKEEEILKNKLIASALLKLTEEEALAMGFKKN